MPARFEAVTTRAVDARRSAPRAASHALDPRLAVVGADDDGVALEELVEPARGLDQRPDRVVRRARAPRAPSGPNACEAKSKSER